MAYPPYADSPGPSFGSRLGKALVRILVTLLLVALAGAVLFLLSEKNAKTYSVAVADGALVVMRGRMFPTGEEPYRPSDPALADSYAPLYLEGGPSPTFVGQKFEDRDALDRALHGFIAAKAEPLVLSDDPQKLDKGLALLRRGGRLTGLTEEQRLTQKRLEAEVAYYQAKVKLSDAQRLFAEALSQLKVAADSQSRHARTAAAMLTAIEAPSKLLEGALRAAVHGLSTPTEPKPAEVNPTEAKPSEPAPADPKPTEPTPAEPAPVDSTRKENVPADLRPAGP